MAEKTGKIYYPPNGRHTHRTHFTAFGRAENVASVSGILRGMTSNCTFPGNTLLQPTPYFWVIQFRIDPVGLSEKYILELRDMSEGTLLDIKGDIVLPRKLKDFDVFECQYPSVADNPICLEFTASGFSDQNGGLSASFDSADEFTYDVLAEPPGDWVIHIAVQNPMAPGTLTISQAGEPDIVIPGLSFQDCDINT
jgi:hypothetical protein